MPPSLRMEVDLTTKTPVAATARAEAIRLNVQQAAVLYTKAVELADWRTLKYTSLRAWATGEFGPDRFSTERLKEIVGLLTKAGLTQRQIAAATGAARNTVAKQQKLVAQNEPQDAPSKQTPRQQAARDREAAKREETKVPRTKTTQGSRGPTGKSGSRISQEALNEAALKALRSGKSQSQFAHAMGLIDNSMMLAKAWTRAEMLVNGEVKASKPKNWNGKSPGGRLRELAGSKKLNYLDVSRFQWEIARATTVLTEFAMKDYVGDGSEPEIDVLTRLQDDLISLSTWLDQQLMGVQGYLSTFATREKIAKLRDTTGRNPEEAAAYARAADRLERQLNKSIESGE